MASRNRIWSLISAALKPFVAGAAIGQGKKVSEIPLSEEARDQQVERLCERADTAFSTGEITKAEESLHRILELIPGDLGNIHLLRSELPEAEARYRQILDADAGKSWHGRLPHQPRQYRADTRELRRGLQVLAAGVVAVRRDRGSADGWAGQRLASPERVRLISAFRAILFQLSVWNSCISCH